MNISMNNNKNLSNCYCKFLKKLKLNSKELPIRKVLALLNRYNIF